MSDSVRPQRQQPTRLPHPRDSPGKNTGVGCHFLLQCMKVKSESEVAQSFPTLGDPMDCSLPGSSVHGFSRQEYWSGVPLPSPISLFESFLNKSPWTQNEIQLYWLLRAKNHHHQHHYHLLIVSHEPRHKVDRSFTEYIHYIITPRAFCGYHEMTTILLIHV